MIVVYHNFCSVTRVVSDFKEVIAFDKRNAIAYELAQLSILFPEEQLFWCLEELATGVNWKVMPELFHHNKLMLSYNPSATLYFGTEMGYVEESPFINVNKKVSYPTWQMSSAIGVIHASVLLLFKDRISLDTNFDYFLSSIAKLGMPRGLLCYSEPKLLKTIPRIDLPRASSSVLFKFVKQHYKFRWLFLLLLNLIIFEKRLSILPFVRALFFKNRNKTAISLDSITVKSSRKVIDQATIDVIIPTIGRKSYLYDVLKDFAKQTHLPKKIIIVEQNPVQGSGSQLDYLTNKKWPFEIRHIFTHQAGVCNARNLALNQVESEWVFLADDDIRIDSCFMQSAFEQITIFGIKGLTFRCFQKGEKKVYNRIFQWGTFGSGCSMVSNDSIKNCSFNNGYEFGFGEDSDFGMQLRNKGYDILYLPEPEILHLKAPVGGFRTKPAQQWQNDIIQPKPSPTVMLYRLLHCTDQQTSSYKTTLFFKYYRLQSIKNPIFYYGYFQKQWERSVFWANKLKQQNEI